MLVNNTYEGILSDPAVEIAVFPAVLIRRKKTQGANIERTGLEQPKALLGIVYDATAFSHHELVLSTSLS